MKVENHELSLLIESVGQNDQQAFNRLYALTAKKLMWVVRKIIWDRHAAEEALQEVYIKIWNNASRYRRDQSAAGWLVQVTKRQSIDFLRSARIDIFSYDFESLRDAYPGPEDVLLTKETEMLILSQILKLEPVSATLVKGAYIDGLSYKQLSDSHNVPLNTVRTILRRSLLKIAREFERP